MSEKPSFYPTDAEQARWLESVNMDEEVENLPYWEKQGVTVAELNLEENGLSGNIVQIFGMLADELGLPVTVQGSTMTAKRDKSREELEKRVIQTYRSEVWQKRRDAYNQEHPDNV